MELVRGVPITLCNATAVSGSSVRAQRLSSTSQQDVVNKTRLCPCAWHGTVRRAR